MSTTLVVIEQTLEKLLADIRAGRVDIGNWSVKTEPWGDVYGPHLLTSIDLNFTTPPKAGK